MVRNCPRIAKMKVALTLAWFIAILISSNARADVLAKITIDMQGRPQISIVHDNPVLQQAGWKTYKVLINNPARKEGVLSLTSNNASPLFHKSRGELLALPELTISDQQLATSTIAMLPEPGLELTRPLTGQREEWRTLQLYTRRPGPLKVELQARLVATPGGVMRGSSVIIPFTTVPATRVEFAIKDELGRPAFAALTITDGVNRLVADPEANPLPQNYRHRYAMRRPWERIWVDGAYQTQASSEPHLTGIYPFPARRLPQLDPFPDLYFQAQVYRGDGEYLYLPPGRYRIDYRAGPETISKSRRIEIGEGPMQTINLNIESWVKMTDLGWYSGDLHVHATACKHFESPSQGVDPTILLRQAKGERLNVVSVLNWAPGWQSQKKHFGHNIQEGLSLLHNDVEVSNFPSNEMGHLGLWGLQVPDYPNTTSVADWPSWNNPILRWAREQRATTGYLHAGWGLKPLESTDSLPNQALAPMTGIGANEYVVAVTEELVDLLGVGDTPPVQELNLWYHALNSGYRTRIMGESDFPCIYHEKIGIARSYARLDKRMSFESYLEALRAGRSYVSDGKSHLIDIAVNGQLLGRGDSELRTEAGKKLTIKLRATAWLPRVPSRVDAFIAGSDAQRQPAWDIARARIPGTREVAVELVMNGHAVASRRMVADGAWNDLQFDVPIDRSSWLALRILPSSHSNPVFVLVDDKPIRASSDSANWLDRAVQHLWESKSHFIRRDELADARAAYEKARAQHQQRANEALVE
ncbi:MAG: CehA/McbA family metallohydrolase [Halieaceae bacterium]|jgi:hypothetical protein|nr:CehA/McbA family metallohydrolase [Halieaceae bacterium]